MAVNSTFNRLIIVSNRLPYIIERDNDTGWRVTPGTGGLVTAVMPILERSGGIWIGWPGTLTEDDAPVRDLLAQQTAAKAFTISPVELTREEKQQYYLGFCNEIIWPLFHDLPSRTNYDPVYWTAYQSVNQKFAASVAEIANSGDFVWVQDYHLMGVASILDRQRIQLTKGFFLHIPFPPPQIFIKLPWRSIILRELLSYDLIGFQTRLDLDNFIRSVRTLTENAFILEEDRLVAVDVEGHRTITGTFPISIECSEFESLALSSETNERVRELREGFGDRYILLGVERLDYTKGILHKLRAFRELLVRYPELRNRVILIQVVLPSRLNIPEYQALKNAIEQLVCEINGTFSEAGWVPVHYYFRGLPRRELVPHYRIADVALVTPVKDGMNLVAKEYCICQPDGNGALILSEFAGAAAQLRRGALLVNPYDSRSVADAIYRALTMDPVTRRKNMESLRSSIKIQDIFDWVNTYLSSVPQEEYTLFN